MKPGKGIAIVLALLTSACASLSPPEELIGAAVPTIRMGVDPGTQEFRVLTPATAECRKAGQDVNGCFEVGKNLVVFARFNLENSPGWQLQQIRICEGETAPTQPCDLSPWNRLEFIAAESRDSEFLLPNKQGFIDLTRLGMDLDGFFLATQNLYERWWYYQLQVCPSGWPPNAAVNDPSCRWNVDPPMKNKGRGRR